MPPAATRSSVDPLNLDRRQLLDLRQRFLDVNAQRLERTRQSLQSRQAQLVDMLPLFFHVNHPSLPGYVAADTPAGLNAYKPEPRVLATARRVFRSFRYQPHTARHQSIHALFVMGSIGTIGQSRSSDLDIWVCHGSELTPSQRQGLETKCQRISLWAKTYSLDICFFPMDAEKFRQGETLALSSESSGSVQHGLLLDEFYRSAVWLAGRYPLWWFIPAAAEADYDRYREELLGKLFFRPTETIDFGAPRVPPEEFVTAAIWQLYKGIHSPYKSVLKLLLLEAYAASYPTTQLLCNRFKAQVEAGITDLEQLDPYLSVYALLSDYLALQGQQRRLEIVRRCFYFKVDKPLSRRSKAVPASWQQQCLTDLVTSWGWTKQHLARLDNRRDWRANQVSDERNLLVKELLHSYRALKGFVRHNPSTQKHLQNDLAVLGNQLQAAFKRKAGKIELINPDISPSLEAPALEFVGRRNDTSKRRWRVIASDSGNSEGPPLKMATSPVELLVWSYNNGIFTSRTHAWLSAPGQPRLRLDGFYKALRNWTPMPLEDPTQEVFAEPAQPRHVLIAVNLLDAGPGYQGGSQLQLDPFNNTEQTSEPLRDIHLIIRNSWNETYIINSSDKPIASLPERLLRLIDQSGDASLTIGIYVRPSPQSALLQERLEKLIKDLSKARLLSRQGQDCLFMLRYQGTYWAWQLENTLSLISCTTESDLLKYLEKPRETPRTFILDRTSMHRHPLWPLSRQPIHDSVRVAYLPQRESAWLLVADGNNSIFSTQVPFYKEANLLRPLHQFIRHHLQQAQTQEEIELHFGVQPIQFLRLSRNPRTKEFDTERRPVSREIRNIGLFDFRVSLRDLSLEPSSIAIDIDDQHFDGKELATNLFAIVAEVVMAHRKSGSRYGCQITAMDFCNTEPTTASFSQPGLIKALRLRYRLEQKINNAMRTL